VNWVRVNDSLVMSSQRQPSGYSYRVRDTGNEVILIAEGRISDGKPPQKRTTCVDHAEAYKLADDWEKEADA
jgi:hypothetical protein